LDIIRIAFVRVAVLFEMIEANPPFENNPLMDEFPAIVKETLLPLPHVPQTA
jgi:hypothetical protein